ncbi:phosphomevalonate kinase, partial [Elasticomyces elasticus]
MASTPTAVSAPGKVLLAGGYLVLDRDYTGLVFALDARIHVHVKPADSSSGAALNEILVSSPQFLGAAWAYRCRFVPGGGGVEVTESRVSASSNSGRNVFIETALSYALSYVTTLIPPNVESASIAILADNDYY